eukprot:GHRR01002290.1.p1 GENE.GHRR01002290.1~~GHRR01002290.1.p1  ORF type:complete len:475 (+),score=123.50 GHRR01002290.1:591-2015(+)
MCTPCRLLHLFVSEETMSGAATSFWNGFGAALQPVLHFADRTGVTGKIKPRAAILPVPQQPMPASSTAEIDNLLQQLDNHKIKWVHVDTKQRGKLLLKCLKNVMRMAPDFAKVGTIAKGSYEGGIGDEMASVLPIVSGLLEYYESMKCNGARAPLKLYRRRNGQLVARVWPVNMVAAFFPNFIGEVWMQPGAEATQGAIYRRKQEGLGGTGQVALVLGAGNQLPVVALDILHMLFAEDQVVLVKMNPVNDYYGPLLRKVFAPLTSGGFLDFVYGGADVGAYCCQHALVQSVHLTGSEATYNNIVFGSSEPIGPPQLTKPVTAELGNITPYIIVPGPWSKEDMEYHARSVASGLAQNAGHNCIAAEVVILDASWPLRSAFLAALSRCLDSLQCRGPWYPGSSARLEAFKQHFPTAKPLGRPVPEEVQPAGHVPAQPWLLVTGMWATFGAQQGRSKPQAAAAGKLLHCMYLQEFVL